MHIHNVATLGTTAKYKQIQNEIIETKIPEGQENWDFMKYKDIYLNLSNIDLNFDLEI